LEEKTLDYEFFASMWNKYSFFKETGEKIDNILKISWIYGATLSMGISHEIAIEFAIDPTKLGDYKEKDILTIVKLLKKQKLQHQESLKKILNHFSLLIKEIKVLLFI
jgi:hypothetical protein